MRGDDDEDVIHDDSGDDEDDGYDLDDVITYPFSPSRSYYPKHTIGALQKV